MTNTYRVRAATMEDVSSMACVHVESWRETYRGTLIADDILDAPDFFPRRVEFWNAALTGPNTIRVAEVDGQIVGVAMSGPVADEEWSTHVYVLYVLALHHGNGVGSLLLDAVLDASASVALWVGDPVPRAQAFYAKHGFTFDGTVKIKDGVRELRMRRNATP